MLRGENVAWKQSLANSYQIWSLSQKYGSGINKIVSKCEFISKNVEYTAEVE